jgi:hypothetical protein
VFKSDESACRSEYSTEVKNPTSEYPCKHLSSWEADEHIDKSRSVECASGSVPVRNWYSIRPLLLGEADPWLSAGLLYLGSGLGLCTPAGVAATEQGEYKAFESC